MKTNEKTAENPPQDRHSASSKISAKRYTLSLVWLRRDLRLNDHHALSQAIAASESVQIVFIFDKQILEALPSQQDRRVEFIWESCHEIHTKLQAIGSGLWLEHDLALAAIPRIAQQLGAEAVYTNHDYEPSANMRDQQVEQALNSLEVDFHHFKDQVIFEKDEVLTASNTSFSVFTPYKNAWLKRWQAQDTAEHVVDLNGAALSWGNLKQAPPRAMSLAELGFQNTNLKALGIKGGSREGARLLDSFSERIGQYGAARDFPAVKGPSYLSVHFRFGTVSIRQAARMAMRLRDTDKNQSAGAIVWLNELIWRDFYFQILHHHPRVILQAYKPAYDHIAWVRDEALFKAFCEAKTGYPLVDAAMEQLNQTGYMHNRLRMVVGSFLTKDLGIDWRWGEKYFADKLIDFDLSANNGGWQWAASTGCDAQPYFRIFNPITQSEKFDAMGKFIKRYLPVLAGLSGKAIHAPWLASPIELAAAGVVIGENYPAPVVDHASARLATLERFQVVKH